MSDNYIPEAADQDDVLMDEIYGAALDALDGGFPEAAEAVYGLRVEISDDPDYRTECPDEVLGDPRGMHMHEMRDCPTLSKERQLELARRWQDHGDREALNELVKSMQRYVLSIAREYDRGDNGNALELMDLVQEASGYLASSLRPGKFNPEKGCKVNSYVTADAIGKYLANVILEHKSPIMKTVTQRKINLIKKVLREESLKGNEMGLSDVDIGWLSERTDLGKDALSNTLEAMACSLFSINDIPGDGDDEIQEYREIVPHPKFAPPPSSPEDMLYRSQIESALDRLMDVVREAPLTPRERDIIRNRFKEDPMTLQEFGDRYNVSRERIRQNEAEALCCLKDYLRGIPGLFDVLSEHAENL